MPKIIIPLCVKFFSWAFQLPELRLVIELDGGVHEEVGQQEHDRDRDLMIREFCIQILRIKNEEVMNQSDKVIEKVKAFLS